MRINKLHFISAVAYHLPLSIFANSDSPQRLRRRQFTIEATSLPLVSSNPDSQAPYGLCQGGCGSDTECEGDLVCFQRDANQNVPGCSGGESDSTSSNYCIEAPSSSPSEMPSESPSEQPSDVPSIQPSEYPSNIPTDFPTRLFLFIYPDNPPPESVTPLGICEGDCDSDEDCDEGLYCHFRDGSEPVPACVGGEIDLSRTDYCAPINFPASRSEQLSESPSEQPSESPSEQPSESPSEPPSESPSEKPSESQSEHPSQAPSEQPSESPSKQPSESPSESPTDMPTRPTLFIFTDNPPPGSVMPLGLCEGDCDSDADCGEGLYCHFRGPTEPVPGCIGGEIDRSRTDYCAPIIVTPGTRAGPTPLPTPGPTAGPTPGPTLGPTTGPTPGPTLEPTSGPTSEPTQSPTSSLPPLGLCQGDCDYDFECAEGLYCFEHDPFQVVPGCTGGESDGSRTAYCIHNSFAPIEQPNPDAFNLQLSWEASFPREEKEWCVQCKKDCIVGDTLFYTPCSGRSTFFEFVSLPSSTSVVQIEVSGTDRCLQRSDEGFIQVRNCDENSVLQRWSPTLQGGTFSDEYFEISQPAFNNDCLGPVGTAEYLDILSMEDCFALRDGFTSFWTKSFPLAS